MKFFLLYILVGMIFYSYPRTMVVVNRGKAQQIVNSSVFNDFCNELESVVKKMQGNINTSLSPEAFLNVQNACSVCINSPLLNIQLVS